MEDIEESREKLKTSKAATSAQLKIKEDAYLVPLKVKVKFASDVISDTKPSGEYETISYYRYVTVDKETIWSTENYVEGYTKTGRTEIR